MADACYIAGYLPGSFKGVPMDCMEATSEHGRRGATGEFPFGEDTAYADLGRRIRKYTLRVRFVANSHIADAAALIDAVESPGSGPLVHPTRGLLQAACVTMKMKDDLYEEQGVSYADLEFVEANDWPAGLSLGGTILGIDITNMLNLAVDTFDAFYDIKDSAPHRRPAIFAAASEQIDNIAREYRIAAMDDDDSKIDQALFDLEEISKDTTLLGDASYAGKAISKGIAAVALQLEGDEKVQAMRRIANAAAKASAMAGIAGETEDSIYALTRITAGAFLAQAAIEAPRTNAGAALAYMDMVTGILEAEARIAYNRCQNELFVELRHLMYDTQRAILMSVNQLPGLIQYKFNGPQHPLIAAYHIFDDAKRHRELELANTISRTGRIGPVITGASA